MIVLFAISKLIKGGDHADKKQNARTRLDALNRSCLDAVPGRHNNTPENNLRYHEKSAARHRAAIDYYTDYPADDYGASLKSAQEKLAADEKHLG